MDRAPRLAAIALVSLLFGAPAHADPRAALQAHGLSLDERAARLSDEEVQALLDGLAALPAKLRATRLRFAVSAKPSAFGMGDGSSDRPLWSDRGRTFHLYAYSEPADERALFRTEKLTAKERLSLWRRRAVVHAVMQRFDDAWRVSRGEDFTLATGWLRPGDRPLTRREERLNLYDWAYSRALGKRSSSLDFVTFAEEALVPPAAVSAERAEPIEDSVACQEFTKTRTLKAALVKAGAGFDDTVLATPVRCELFEAFADRSAISHLELLLSAPSSTSAESIFGHLLLRPVYRWEAHTPSPSFQPVMEIGAFFGLNTPTHEYVWRGLTGNSVTFFAFNSMTVVLKRSLELEQRSLTRFRLNLSEDEVRRVMQRLWELERRGYFPYYFFTENCAAWMQFLLDGALDPERRIGRIGTLWVMPLSTIDALADATGANGEPLLLPVAEQHKPSGVIALAEEAKLDETVAELEAQRPSVDWDRLVDARHDTDGHVRKAAYAQLATALSSAPRPLAQRLSRSLLKVERFAADHAAGRERKVQDKARVVEDASRIPSADELLRRRQQRYQRERPAERFAAESASLLEFRTLYDTLPQRPLTASEQQEVDNAVAAREAFEAAALMFASFSSPDESRALDVLETVTEKARAEQDLHGSLFRSGSYRFSAGAAAFRSGNGRYAPAAFVSAALVSEQLGEPRVMGFGPEYDVRILNARALVGVERSLPSLLWGDLDVLQLRALGRRPQLARTSLLHRFGWGIGMSYAHRRAGPTMELHRLLIEGNLFGTTFRSVDFGRHLSLGVGAAIETPLYPVASLNTGLRSLLLARLPLPGHGINALRAELSFSQRVGLFGPGRQLAIQEGSVALEVPLFLTDHGKPGFVLRPRAELYGRRVSDALTVTGFVMAAGEWD